MACPPVAVDKDRAGRFQHTSDGGQSRAQEVEVVVQVGPRVAVSAVGGGKRSAGVERRIDVGQVHDRAGRVGQHVQTVAEDDLIEGGRHGQEKYRLDT